MYINAVSNSIYSLKQKPAYAMTAMQNPVITQDSLTLQNKQLASDQIHFGANPCQLPKNPKLAQKAADVLASYLMNFDAKASEIIVPPFNLPKQISEAYKEMITRWAKHSERNSLNEQLAKMSKTDPEFNSLEQKIQKISNELKEEDFNKYLIKAEDECTTKIKGFDNQIDDFVQYIEKHKNPVAQNATVDDILKIFGINNKVMPSTVEPKAPKPIKPANVVQTTPLLKHRKDGFNYSLLEVVKRNKQVAQDIDLNNPKVIEIFDTIEELFANKVNMNAAGSYSDNMGNVMQELSFIYEKANKKDPKFKDLITKIFGASIVAYKDAANKIDSRTGVLIPLAKSKELRRAITLLKENHPTIFKNLDNTNITSEKKQLAAELIHNELLKYEKFFEEMINIDNNNLKIVKGLNAETEYNLLIGNNLEMRLYKKLYEYIQLYKKNVQNQTTPPSFADEAAQNVANTLQNVFRKEVNVQVIG